MKFSYSNTTQIHFGQGQIAQLATAIPLNKKVLVIYGGGSIIRNGVYDQVVVALERHQWSEFSGVEPNPTYETLSRAVQLIKEGSFDYLLAVGGGSVIDGTKYIAAAALHDGDGWDLMTGKETVEQALPIGCVLTLPATGSESNIGAVITKAETQDKLCLVTPKIQPEFAVMDPDVMKSLPERQLANGLVDAWVHVCEQYITQPNPSAGVQEGYAEVLLRNLRTLGKTFHQRDSDAWRSNFMWTANQALNGLIGAGVSQDWATHLIGHEMTALYGVDHGRSLAIVHPSLLRAQLKEKRAKLEQMGTNVFGFAYHQKLAEQTIDAIESFYHQLGVATQLTEYSETKEDAITAILQQLEKHGMTAMGENQSITPERCHSILAEAVA